MSKLKILHNYVRVRKTDFTMLVITDENQYKRGSVPLARLSTLILIFCVFIFIFITNVRI